tara:strand:- start:1267 stop:1638 length:372 start_codon:yes stop_codon:yes gene_type:complete
MAFKLGNRSTRPNTPTEKPMVFRKNLEGSTLAEANMDGTINIDHSIKPGSKQETRIIKHEMSHVDDIETGRAAYGDDWVMWEGDVYFRKTIDGVDVIDGPNGRWPDGDENHPWEAKAIQAEKE